MCHAGVVFKSPGEVQPHSHDNRLREEGFWPFSWTAWGRVLLAVLLDDASTHVLQFGHLSLEVLCCDGGGLPQENIYLLQGFLSDLLLFASASMQLLRLGAPGFSF